ncbi:MAG: hypothetical protein AAF266_05840 [Planctomycetota bacterium]
MLPLAVLLLSGCSQSPFDADATGTITLDGNPVPPGVVIFAAEKPGAGASKGNIEDGRYVIITRHERGLDPGKYRVAVRVFDKGTPPAPGERQMAKLAPLVPEKYLDPKTSGLEYEVKPGSNEINIELTSG